jgi:anti-sigma regulatory factor (Ser/Thr protein kinase)
MDLGTASVRAGARHAAVLYSTPDELARRLLAPLRAALADDAPAVAVVDAPTRAELHRELGGDAHRVAFPDPAAVHAAPAFTVAVRWARCGRGVRTPQGRAAVVGQHVAGLGCPDAHWARLDIGLNVAVEGQPIAVLCPYRGDDPQLDRVRATHPLLETADGTTASADYRPPGDVLVHYPPPPPPDLGPPAVEIDFTVDGLGAVRRAVAAVAGEADAGRAADLVLAVNEIASNTVEHGPGRGRARIWADGDGVTAEVADGGRTDLRFPGMVPPPASGVRGRGLWLASELCDVLQVWSDPAGTVVRLHTGRVRPVSC